jgi:hypothetical protein
MLKISKAGKMPCPSWSLQARETCPGSIDQSTKQILPVCKACYAVKGNYSFKPVKALRDYNREDWKRDTFETEFVIFLNDYRFFRWFDSGDIYHEKLAEKIYNIMVKTPWCKHWLPTKSYNIPKLRFWLDKMKKLDNVSVRFSSPDINGNYVKGLHGSCVIPKHDFKTDATICHAYENSGKCGDCRACWNKDVETIAYVKH